LSEPEPYTGCSASKEEEEEEEEENTTGKATDLNYVWGHYEIYTNNQTHIYTLNSLPFTFLSS
jgi:hypothetical protein